MSKTELVELIAKEAGLSKADAVHLMLQSQVLLLD